ncbi:porimin [Astyanax mexicanus]|uniref:porimin n=1 Tax=Astyanax mexicanus TaxID=7994 RepID=UPI0020CAE4BC|nr:porimin [Astyanax mexicanus]
MEVRVGLIFSCCFIFIQMWDSSASLQTNNRTTALTFSQSHSPELEYITHTAFVTRVAATTTTPPVHTSGIVPTSPPSSSSGPHFHVGSFLGGMMFAFVITLVASLGYRLVCSRRTVRYRAIEEHDAVI